MIAEMESGIFAGRQTMSEPTAPERIWVTSTGFLRHAGSHVDTDVEYIRADLAAPADVVSREAAAMVAQNYGTEAYKEHQKQFTTKDRRTLRAMQDVADSIAKDIRALPPATPAVNVKMSDVMAQANFHDAYSIGVDAALRDVKECEKCDLCEDHLPQAGELK